MTAFLGGINYTVYMALNNDDIFIDNQCFDMVHEGEMIDLYRTVTTMIDIIRNNDVDHIIIDDGITRLVVEYVILTVINALDDKIEIEGLDNLLDYESTKNILSLPSDEDEAQDIYTKFREFLSKSIADSYQE